MTARRATPSDLDHVVELGLRFHANSVYAGAVPVVRDDWTDFASKLLASDTAAVFVSPAGFCGGMLNPAYWNYGARIADELFWYAEDCSGTDLRLCLETWARDEGADLLRFTCQADDHEPAMRRMMGMRGFRATEISLQKRL